MDEHTVQDGESSLTALVVDIEEGLHLCADILVAPRLEIVHALRVAVHRVADPGHHLRRRESPSVFGPWS